MRALTNSPHDWAGVGELILCVRKKCSFRKHGAKQQGKPESSQVFIPETWKAPTQGSM